MPAPHLVLIPGLLCTRELYAAQVGALAHQASITIADHRRSDTMAAIARDILANAPERFALAGLSMGGYIAFEILRQAPERVERLALLDTSPRPDLPEQTENRLRLVALAEKRGVASAAREMFPKLVAPARQNDPALSAAFLRMSEETGSEAFARQQRAIAARADPRPPPAPPAPPPLAPAGAGAPPPPPPLSVEMSTAIPASRLAVVPHAGHLSTLEEPAAVTTELRAWLGA